MQKENGTLEHTKRNAISFLNFKEKHIEKFNKCPAHPHHPLLKTLAVKGLQREHKVFKIAMKT